MFFNNKLNNNIDKEFENNNALSPILNIFVSIIIVIILMINPFVNRKIEHQNEQQHKHQNEYQIEYQLDLIGENNITLYQGSEYIEPGYKAYNSKDEDLTNEVIINSSLDMSNPGDYVIEYKIGDISKTRTITVIEKVKEYTYINLKSVDNDINVYLKLNEKYVEPGYEASNSNGDDLTDKVKVSGKVNTSKKGTYELVYSIVDANGVTKSVSRTVTVIDTEIKLTLSSTTYTNKETTIKVEIVDKYFDYIELPDGTKTTKSTYEYKVSKNGTYKFTVYNKKGMAKEESIKVTTIDKEAPTVSCNGSYKDGKSTVNVIGNDNVGISKYIINGVEYNSNEKKMTKIINGELETVSITIYDKAGNSNKTSCKLEDKNPKVYYEREMNVHYFDGESGSGLAYWLYIPEGATENMPLVVYIHGSEGYGNDYKNGTKYTIKQGPGNDVYNSRKEYNTIMLMPQLTNSGYSNMTELIELIDYVADIYKVNKNKISLSAVSGGAWTITKFIGDNASYFSAISVLGTYPQNPDKFVSVPVLIMCGEYDSERISSMQNFAKKINELGGNATYYTIPGKGHDIVSSSSYSVFRDDNYKVVEWMTSQTKK